MLTHLGAAEPVRAPIRGEQRIRALTSFLPDREAVPSRWAYPWRRPWQIDNAARQSPPRSGLVVVLRRLVMRSWGIGLNHIGLASSEWSINKTLAGVAPAFMPWCLVPNASTKIVPGENSRRIRFRKLFSNGQSPARRGRTRHCYRLYQSWVVPFPRYERQIPHANAAPLPIVQSCSFDG